jgi:hypothetical protein
MHTLAEKKQFYKLYEEILICFICFIYFLHTHRQRYTYAPMLICSYALMLLLCDAPYGIRHRSGHWYCTFPSSLSSLNFCMHRQIGAGPHCALRYSHTHMLLYSYAHMLICSYAPMLIYSYTHILLCSYATHAKGVRPHVSGVSRCAIGRAIGIRPFLPLSASVVL